jgi:hypothetical protein
MNAGAPKLLKLLGKEKRKKKKTEREENNSLNSCLVLEQYLLK